jgi:hypothetical protein
VQVRQTVGLIGGCMSRLHQTRAATPTTVDG